MWYTKYCLLLPMNDFIPTFTNRSGSNPVNDVYSKIIHELDLMSLKLYTTKKNLNQRCQIFYTPPSLSGSLLVHKPSPYWRLGSLWLITHFFVFYFLCLPWLYSYLFLSSKFVDSLSFKIWSMCLLFDKILITFFIIAQLLMSLNVIQCYRPSHCLTTL